MPMAQMANTILIGGKTDNLLIEPIKKNAYRLYLYVTDLISVLRVQFPDDRDYLETIKVSLSNNAYPIEISFTPPAIQIEQRKIRGGANVEVKYAGWVSYGNAEATFHNWIDLDTYQFFYRWASLAGALPLFRSNDTLRSAYASIPLPVPDINADSKAGAYKVNGSVSSFYNWATEGDEIESGHWVLQGIFPTSVSAADFNHADDGESLLTTVSFSVDLALPTSPAIPRASLVPGQQFNVAQASRT